MTLYNVYEQQNFKEFNFSEFGDICKLYNINGLTRKQCFITSSQNCKQELRLLDIELKQLVHIKPANLNFIDDDVIAKHGIFFGRFSNPLDEGADTKLGMKIYQQLLSKQLNWLINFFEYIHSYLSKRVSAGKYLTNHDVMRINLAEVIEDIKLAQTLFLNEASLDSLRAISKIILRAVKNLANCAGGRSFAGGNILEIFWLMSLLNEFIIGEDKNVY